MNAPTLQEATTTTTATMVNRPNAAYGVLITIKSQCNSRLADKKEKKAKWLEK